MNRPKSFTTIPAGPRFLGTVLDITERKQSEEALQASEERIDGSSNGPGRGLDP